MGFDHIQKSYTLVEDSSHDVIRAVLYNLNGSDVTGIASSAVPLWSTELSDSASARCEPDDSVAKRSAPGSAKIG